MHHDPTDFLPSPRSVLTWSVGLVVLVFGGLRLLEVATKAPIAHETTAGIEAGANR